MHMKQIVNYLKSILIKWDQKTKREDKERIRAKYQIMKLKNDLIQPPHLISSIPSNDYSFPKDSKLKGVLENIKERFIHNVIYIYIYIIYYYT